VERGPQPLERLGAGLAARGLEVLRGVDQRLDRRALGRRRVAQRGRALARDGLLLGGAQIVDGVQQRVDEVAVLAREHVRRPRALAGLRELGDGVGGVALLGLAQLARGRIALTREVLQRQAVEPTCDVFELVSHPRRDRWP
jgi:hypothetical protein